jgi:hypothetical protein
MLLLFIFNNIQSLLGNIWTTVVWCGVVWCGADGLLRRRQSFSPLFAMIEFSSSWYCVWYDDTRKVPRDYILLALEWRCTLGSKIEGRIGLELAVETDVIQKDHLQLSMRAFRCRRRPNTSEVCPRFAVTLARTRCVDENNSRSVPTCQHSKY